MRINFCLTKKSSWFSAVPIVACREESICFPKKNSHWNITPPLITKKLKWFFDKKCLRMTLAGKVERLWIEDVNQEKKDMNLVIQVNRHIYSKRIKMFLYCTILVINANSFIHCEKITKTIKTTVPAKRQTLTKKLFWSILFNRFSQKV